MMEPEVPTREMHSLELLSREINEPPRNKIRTERRPTKKPIYQVVSTLGVYV